MRRGIKRFILLMFLLGSVALNSVAAQAERQLRITKLDITDFPLVRLNLLTADSHSAPLADLAALRLRENGIPVADFDLATMPVGIDVTFVIDANDTFTQVDDDNGLARREKVQESIKRFANHFMNPSGLDRVTIVAPDENNEDGRLLLENADTPEAVITAINSYIPEPAGETPLNDMMALALERAAQRQGDGRFQAILLFTDGARVGRQLAYPALVEQAQATYLPIFAAILGARADPNEIDGVARLYQPTGASYVHMAAATATDAIYQVWQQQGNQPQIHYHSLQKRSGRYAVTVNLGEVQTTAELNLTLEPPEVTLLFDGDMIHRVGDAPDSSLASLEPTNQAISLAIQWPDGLPRQLVAATLFVNGQPEPQPGVLPADARELLTLNWNIRNLDTGAYTLTAQVTDVLGFGVESEPLALNIAVERPLPVVPTAAADEPETAGSTVKLPASQERLLLGTVAVGVAGMLLLLLRELQRRRSQASSEAEPGRSMITPETLGVILEAVETIPLVAFLELLEDAPGNVTRIVIEGDNVVIGRDHEVAQIVFGDKNVSRLHARIKKNGGSYWLYDEGSSSGTQLNFERLGLAPRPLHDEDTIHIGRIPLRFHLKPPSVV